MAYTTPKTDWTEDYTPSPSDFNRIEGNTKSNREDLSADILLEEAARIAADDILSTAIDTEESARIAADDTKMPLPTTSTDIGLTNYPIGTIVFVRSSTVVNINASQSIGRPSNTGFDISATNQLSGTWRSRGGFDIVGGIYLYLFQRVS